MILISMGVVAFGLFGLGKFLLLAPVSLQQIQPVQTFAKVGQELALEMEQVARGGAGREGVLEVVRSVLGAGDKLSGASLLKPFLRLDMKDGK